MTRIGLISDTHGYLDGAVFEHFKDCDEVWHAGDFGGREIAEKLSNLTLDPSPKGEGGRVDQSGDFSGVGMVTFFPKHRIFRGVYGNIDGPDIRRIYPEKLFFTCEEVNVFMQHIGGYPGRYATGVKDDILKHNVQLFISGHSHILKIMYDDKLNCLHMNPGAAGRQGWHTVRTLIRFTIDGKEIKDCEVVELGGDKR